MGSVSNDGARTSCLAWVIAMLAATAASAQTGQSGTSTPSGPQTEKPQAPETAPAQRPESPLPVFATIGPSREIKIAEHTWFRFGAQVQAWYRAAQDRLQGSPNDGTYAQDYYCRRCRLFTTGSVVKDVFFNILFEAGNFGKADPATGVKSFASPNVLDAYAQVKFADAFWLSGGNILLPLNRNGMQPTTTYVSLDASNVAQTPVLQGNTLVLRDLGFQANGFFLANHLEYRVGVFQGSRQAAAPSGCPSATGATTNCTQTASHNGPRLVSMLSLNFWDPETGYVNGGHYYGARRVLGVMGNFDYQILRTDAPGFPATPLGSATVPPAGTSKNAYYGVSAAAFINYPLKGPNPKGGDEIVGLLQFGYYDGGLRTSGATVTNPGTYPNVLKQWNYLAEAGYYNHTGHFSIFGKFEDRKISGDYPGPVVAGSNQYWLAGGLKYYVAPFNLLNFTLQYERNQFTDTDKATLQPQQSGTNTLTFQMQLLLY
ncbi:MAG TPA: hypothetical protein VG496_20020 [Myxococcales bacterium]|nr:hypothetical protein [Myxococcales bacterium]